MIVSSRVTGSFSRSIWRRGGDWRWLCRNNFAQRCFHACVVLSRATANSRPFGHWSSDNRLRQISNLCRCLPIMINYWHILSQMPCTVRLIEWLSMRFSSVTEEEQRQDLHHPHRRHVSSTTAECEFWRCNASVAGFVKQASQNEHSATTSWSGLELWVLSCIRQWSARVNRLEHTKHLYCLIPMWIRSCLLHTPDWLKTLLQNLHVRLFVPPRVEEVFWIGRCCKHLRSMPPSSKQKDKKTKTSVSFKGIRYKVHWE